MTKTHLAMTIAFVLDDATWRAFPAFSNGGVGVIFDSVDGDVNNCPTIRAQLLALSNEVYFSCGNHRCKHLELCKHLPFLSKISKSCVVKTNYDSNISMWHCWDQTPSKIKEWSIEVSVCSNQCSWNSNLSNEHRHNSLKCHALFM